MARIDGVSIIKTNRYIQAIGCWVGKAAGSSHFNDPFGDSLEILVPNKR